MLFYDLPLIDHIMNKTKSSTTFINNETVYDFLFIGLGAGNSLILLSLLKKGLASNKKIAVVEPTKKNTNDKTYCFWASPNDSIVTDLKPIISHFYTAIEVNGSPSQNIEKQPYYFIKSIDLYEHIINKLVNEDIPILSFYADTIISVDEIYHLNTSGGIIKSKFIFDSRTPPYSQLSSNEIYLNQSFYGLHIKCEKPVFLKDSFEMMNFNVDQSDFTQFVYTLPFSSNESLIELTRFGSEKIDLDYAKKILDKKIKAEYGSYEIVAEESGCIPMTSYQHPKNDFQGVLNTGAKANLIKPSTGYGFKNMYNFASIVSDNIYIENFKHFNQISLHKKSRFRFYDILLLTILLIWPKKGKKIFTNLFKSQNIYTIFLFLDEKTTVGQEIKIFASLPIFTFIKSLFIHLKKTNGLRYLFSFVSVLIYFIIHYFSTVTSLNFGYFLIIIGLLLVGIPHGSVDHLIKIENKSSLFQFILKYLILIISYFLIWHYFPLFSIIFFILYSSFHFGESELEEMGINLNSISIYIRGFLIGLSILLFIIFTHLNESIEVISKIGGLENIKLITNELILYKIPLSLISLVYLLCEFLLFKKSGFLMLILMLIVGCKMPLILAFSLYFICQHSLNAWGHLKLKLHINSMPLYKKALPYLIGALSLFLALFIFDFIGLFNLYRLQADGFIFLACISLPHVILMHLFYKKKIIKN